eukprot:Platyproteum_vivax@DN970_c0_g1_i1.p1
MSSPIIPSTTYVKHIGFNQNQSRLTIGTNAGLMVFQVDPWKLLYSKELGSVDIVEMYLEEPLFALVGPKHSRRLLIFWDAVKDDMKYEKLFNDAIRAVKMNRTRIVVVLNKEFHILDKSSLRSETVLTRLTPNKSSVCCLSPSLDRALLAYPFEACKFCTYNSSVPCSHTSSTFGCLALFDCDSLSAVGVIPMAHESAIQCVAFNPTASLVATASTRATLIRVWFLDSTVTASRVSLEGKRMCQFYRGVASELELHDMSFSADSQFLCVSCKSGTVHVFQVDPEIRNNMRNPFFDMTYSHQPGTLSPALSSSPPVSSASPVSSYSPSNLTSLFSSLASWAIHKSQEVVQSTLQPILPLAVSDWYNSTRAHATAKPKIITRGKQVACVFQTDTAWKLLIVYDSGNIFTYQFTTEANNQGNAGCELLHEGLFSSSLHRDMEHVDVDTEKPIVDMENVDADQEETEKED